MWVGYVVMPSNCVASSTSTHSAHVSITTRMDVSVGMDSRAQNQSTKRTGKKDLCAHLFTCLENK